HQEAFNPNTDALSRKERIKPKRVQAMNMIIQLSIKDMILVAQNEASEVIGALAEMLQGLDIQMKRRSNGAWTNSRHDAIWVIIDRLTKSAHFLHIREDYKMERLARLYLSEIIVRHGVPILIISDRDSRFYQGFGSQYRRH
ncbi:putative reverse transcriptase domain-containing protein, partial [Tanacetum coccineum]